MIGNFDLHLAAFRIDPGTISQLERMGFVRDEFANNTRCERSEYHATYRGAMALPSDSLWQQTVEFLKTDNNFSGGLEEERAGNSEEFTGDSSFWPGAPRAIESVTCPAGKHKACDIHIRIELEQSSEEAVNFLERLTLASFEKPGPRGVRRIYTATSETVEDGEKLFSALVSLLRTVPGLRGRAKLEYTTRFFRFPEDAPSLPLVTTSALRRWFGGTSQGLAMGGK